MGLRKYLYAAATLALVMIVGWATYTAWLEFRRLYQNFASVQADAFHLSEHIEASVRDLNETVLRFDLHRNPADREAFQAETAELELWMQEHMSTVTTQTEHDLMMEIESALDTYITLATKLMDERAQAVPSAALTPVFDQVDRESAPLLNLCEELQHAERAAQIQFMKDSHRALGWLQQLLVVLLALALVLIGTAAIAIYRGVIGPLRVELGQSRAAAARHEQLASLGTLAAGVAHEIRNPLTAISVRLHGLRKTLSPGSSEHEDAEVIGHEIERMEHIVQEFLQFARPADPKLFNVSADSLLSRMRSLFGPQLAKMGIQLKIDSVPDIWLRADPNQIEQALINLIQNSAESMDRDGTIVLRARNGSGRHHARAVVLEVSDTGRGISTDVRRRMFDPFFTTKSEGTGLGLSIVARIVEKHRGVLQCRSEAGHGTTFTIILPQIKSGEPNDITT